MINPFASVVRLQHQARDVRRSAGVSIVHQLRELRLTRRASGMSRAEYYRYRLWRPALDDLDRLAYTCQRERRVTERLTNGPKPAIPVRKSVELATFAAAGLPVPTTLGRIAPGPESTIASRDALAKVLAAAGTRGLVIKPEHGQEGRDILVVAEARAEGVTLHSGERLGIDALWHHLAGADDPDWQLESWIAPHPDLAGFRPGATPTLRILVIRLDGGCVAHAASLKLPVTDQGVDNLHAGNLAAGVDLATGAVGPATDRHGIVWHDRHPASGIPITGLRVPHWDRVLEVAIEGMRHATDLRALGWDIAVSADGPVILEANRSWAEDLMQLPAGAGLMRGGLLRLLHEVGADQVLERRRRLVPRWRDFERREVAAFD